MAYQGQYPIAGEIANILPKTVQKPTNQSNFCSWELPQPLINTKKYKSRQTHHNRGD